MISEKDKTQLAAKGISEEKLLKQLDCFRTGFPYLKLAGAATVGHGILRADEALRTQALAAWDSYCTAGHKIVKFVPASGAASRMFKNMFAFVDADYDVPTTDFEKTWFEKLENAPYYEALDDACHVLYEEGIATLIEEGRYKDVVSAMLSEEGLDYGSLPKGLLLFHAYDDCVRTPAEEHLVEGALYAKEKDGSVNVHFTVSPEHRDLFEELVEEKAPELEAAYGVKYNVSFSEQKSATDTVAATPEGEPFRLADGSLLFRPGGHGALIENLNDIDADVIFVKNIDNVVPDYMKPVTVDNKRLLAGILVTLQQKAFGYLQLLESGTATPDDIAEIKTFLEHDLCCTLPDGLDGAALSDVLKHKLNRPMRVCGMVKNVGEPGGGPFLSYNADGSVSPQILESVQIDTADPEKKAMFENGTHFNPVDLVCAVRDYKGHAFDLPAYVDPQTGFISHKSKDGKELQALELPGLWNGAMSDWNTVFVEVPLDTFNPVKTVNDLYRPQHQPQD